MRVDEIFTLRYGHSLALNSMSQVDAPDGVNFVSRAMNHNGVTGRVKPPEGLKLGRPGELTVALSGNGVLSTFVQPEAFVTGYHVMILSPNWEMSLQEKLWWAQCILHNKYRFSYGRQANRTLASLELPEEVPSWVKGVEANLHLDHEIFGEAIPSDRVRSRDENRCTVGDLFSVQYGQSLELNRLSRVEAPAGVNFVSRTTKGNGISARVLLPDGVVPSPAHSLSVALGGNPLTTFYQDEPYVCGRDVAVLTPRRDMEVGEMLWWKVVIEANRYRYSYGRQANRTLAELFVPTFIPENVAATIQQASDGHLFASTV